MIQITAKSTKNLFRIISSSVLVLTVLFISLNRSYLLFHTLIELLSIVVAFTVFVITWNAKKVLDNQYLLFVGIAYLFIGGLDLLHTLSFSGMNIIQGKNFYANQFWVATRSMEALTLVFGFYFLNSKRKINSDLLFCSYLAVSVLIILSILYWHIFPTCYIEGLGQTKFKIFAEYLIIIVLFLAGYLLHKRKKHFDPLVYKFLVASIFFTILSEFSFTLYFDNNSIFNVIGHLFKLVSFYLIYKANVETGFTKPTTVLFNSIKESEFRYRTLANNLPVLIFRFDKQLNCTYTNANDRATDKELLKQLVAKIKHLLTNLITSTNHALQSEIKLTNADEVRFLCLDIILEDRENELADETYLILCQDITKLKLAEEQLTDLNATKDKFFSIIAHDLKNPFTTILASNELIHKSAPKLGLEKVQQLASKSHEAAKNAHTLLENLLSWSMVQTGVLKPKPEQIEIDNMIERVVKTMHATASSKGIEINFSPSGALQCYADANMLDTVLRNLVSNAIKFSFADTAIDIAALEEVDSVKFSVTDQGIGIDEKSSKNLLSNNLMVSKDGTAKEKGTGIGLQLCKDFIHLNGGKLNIISAPGEGTTFEFWLPKIS
ncbi:MAG TPA: MASE3 domain-containing protein [Pelobium sp.]|nr:MASE3 domain-containing protein [Pelobium sp.]